MQMCIAVPLKPLCSGGEVTLHAAVNYTENKHCLICGDI